jgi:mRNA interferase MazF
MKYGEVWLVNFEPHVGQEIRKTRPAIIVNHDSVGKLPLKIVVPLTDAMKIKQEWMVELKPSQSNGLEKVSFADCFQIKSLSEQRLIKKIGILNEEEISEVQITLIKVLNLI